MRMMDGGISRPNVPDPAIVPSMRLSSYPRALSSGTATLATVAQDAAEDPLSAAKIPEARMPTWLRPPGMDRIHGARPENRSPDMRERNRISPIQMNSGRAARDHSEDELQTLVASTLVKGALENSRTPTRPVRNSAM